MSLPYELVALDLDYTFLNDAHAIPPRNLAAVHKCSELGVKVVITSGRMFRSTMKYVRAIGLETPAITYNGAYVKQESTGQVLLSETLDAEVAISLVDYCAAHDLNLNYYLDDTLYVAKATPWGELYSQRTGVPLTPVGDLRKLTNRAPTKVLIVAEPELILKLKNELSPIYADRSYITISNVEYLEFIPKGVDKGKALAVVANFYGIPRENVIVFGDADNDVPMIAWAGLGVAMANAQPDAIAAADRIAPRYDDDGVAVVLEEIFGFAYRDNSSDNGLLPEHRR